MNISAALHPRPVGTTLLAVALFLLGAVAYFFLPVASLPAVDFPVDRHQRDSARAPIPRRWRPPSPRRSNGACRASPALNELTSTNSLGNTQIIAQFDIDANIDAAARDVQAAINAALTDLPTDLPTSPTFRKASQSTMPVLVLAMTSDTLPTSAIFDADRQRHRPAHFAGSRRRRGAHRRRRAAGDPRAGRSGAARRDGSRRRRSGAARSSPPTRIPPSARSTATTQEITLGTTDQLSTPEDYRNIVIASRQRRDRQARRRRHGRTRRAQPNVGRLVQRQAGRAASSSPSSPTPMSSRRSIRSRRCCRELQEWIPSGIKINDPLRPHADDPRQHPRHSAHAGDLRRCWS